MSEAMGKRVAVGMSGGVDSSVAALLLRDAGYEVLGMTLRMRDDSPRKVGLADAERAARMADSLGIPHVVVDAREAFEERIIRPFADEYAAGRTPSPCVRCNPLIKFGLMLDEARKRDCEAVATGHYARCVREGGAFHLRRGLDARKDQSYFLHRLTREMLGRALFPLGAHEKTEVRRLAQERGLACIPSGESQDLCFVESERYAAFVEQYHPELSKTGRFVDEEGRVLGTHHGFHGFTIGQRKGLGLAAEAPYHVKRLCPDSGDVVVAFREKVESEMCALRETSWINGPPAPGRYLVQIRYKQAPVWARVEPGEEAAARVLFEKPQFAIAPGQACVVYAGDEVLGGGWIA